LLLLLLFKLIFSLPAAISSLCPHFTFDIFVQLQNFSLPLCPTVCLLISAPPAAPYPLKADFGLRACLLLLPCSALHKSQKKGMKRVEVDPLTNSFKI